MRMDSRALVTPHPIGSADGARGRIDPHAVFRSHAGSRTFAGPELRVRHRHLLAGGQEGSGDECSVMEIGSGGFEEPVQRWLCCGR